MPFDPLHPFRPPPYTPFYNPLGCVFSSSIDGAEIELRKASLGGGSPRQVSFGPGFLVPLFSIPPLQPPANRSLGHAGRLLVPLPVLSWKRGCGPRGRPSSFLTFSCCRHWPLGLSPPAVCTPSRALPPSTLSLPHVHPAFST